MAGFPLKGNCEDLTRNPSQAKAPSLSLLRGFKLCTVFAAVGNETCVPA